MKLPYMTTQKRLALLRLWNKYAHYKQKPIHYYGSPGFVLGEKFRNWEAKPGIIAINTMIINHLIYGTGFVN